MMYAETRSECEAARTRFAAEYRAKYPKAVESLSIHWDRLTAFFDLPAEHWKHLRTTNVIESAFATVRLRERATKGAGSRTKGLLMAFKLLDMAQQRWRRLDGAHLLPLVRAGVMEFRNQMGMEKLFNQLITRGVKPPDHASSIHSF